MINIGGFKDSLLNISFCIIDSSKKSYLFLNTNVDDINSSSSFALCWLACSSEIFKFNLLFLPISSLYSIEAIFGRFFEDLIKKCQLDVWHKTNVTLWKLV